MGYDKSESAGLNFFEMKRTTVDISCFMFSINFHLLQQQQDSTNIQTGFEPTQIASLLLLLRRTSNLKEIIFQF